MSRLPAPHITTEPRSAPWIDAAVELGGGVVVGSREATAVVWTHPDDPEGLRALLDSNPTLDWVQLPWAGVEPYREVIDHRRTWSCAKGIYADPVAEHALALLLGGFRELHRYARRSSWGQGQGRNLFGARVTILGGGGIARSLIALLAPFRCHVTVVRRSPEPVDGAARVLAADDLHEALAGADVVVLALPLLPDNHRVVGAAELALLAPGAWVVNVARGAHIDTDALLAALDGGGLGGAALDVTDPEPLPPDHPLWSRPDVMITPHTANTPEMAKPLLTERIATNVARYAAGQELLGLVDPDLGY
ncbi:D-isomer specific 2-hydroxyacid dehydrogenase family protein [soil metagenome]